MSLSLSQHYFRFWWFHSQAGPSERWPLLQCLILPAEQLQCGSEHLFPEGCSKNPSSNCHWLGLGHVTILGPIPVTLIGQVWVRCLLLESGRGWNHSACTTWTESGGESYKGKWAGSPGDGAVVAGQAKTTGACSRSQA